MTTRTLTLAGHAVVVTDVGPGPSADDDAPPRAGGSRAPDDAPVTPPGAVVLVHGIGVSSTYFRRLVPGLEGSLRVVAPDLPGFGASPRPDGPPLDVGDHADVLAALVEELGLDRPVLVGHSMGAQFVTELAVRRPDLVGAVVLLGPVVDPAARSLTGQGLRLAVDFVREPPRGALLNLREWLRTGVRWYAATARVMVAYRLQERLPLVTVPVAVVRGQRDPVAPSAFVQALADGVAGGTAHEVPGGAHLVQWSRPDAVRAVVDAARQRALAC